MNRAPATSVVFRLDVPDGAEAVLQPSPTDMLFLLLLGAALAAVALVGWRSFDESHKAFVATSNAKVWAQWLAEAGPQRGKSDFHPQACALAATKDEQPPLAIMLEGTGRELLIRTESGQGGGAPAQTPSDGSWRACEQALREGRGALAGLRNPYSGESQSSTTRCDAADPKTAGAILVEKALPSLTEPRPLQFSPLAGEDLVQAPLKLRLGVCNRWGQMQHVAEVDF